MPLTFAEAAGRLARAGEPAVPETVDGLLRAAVDAGASDLHLEPGVQDVELRLRIDGVLRPAGTLEGRYRANLVARLKVLADLVTYRSDLPQEGRIPRERVGLPVDLRVSTFPTLWGEKAVVRIFDPARMSLSLDALGLPEADRILLEERLRRPGGTILLTGPSGSGKTTLIYAALRRLLELGGRGRHIVTVEDPIEQAIPGITQTQVHPAVGLTFGASLRSLLRQDPEVIVIGEVRDRETARIAIEAGLTGHQVITTLHSGCAAGAFTRLLEMEIEPYLLTSSIALVTAQRLVRVLCPSCRVSAPVPTYAGALAAIGGREAWAARGCADCRGSGYRGRTLLTELLAVGDAVREAVRARRDSGAIHAAALADGMTPLAESACALVLCGRTDPVEALRVL